MNPDKNLHHVWHQRRWYKSPLDKEFRAYKGFVILMPVEDHRDLHAAVMPPLKPSPALMRLVLDNLRGNNVGLEDSIPATLDILAANTARNIASEHQVRRIGANLLAQSEFFIAPEQEASPLIVTEGQL